MKKSIYLFACTLFVCAFLTGCSAGESAQTKEAEIQDEAVQIRPVDKMFEELGKQAVKESYTFNKDPFADDADELGTEEAEASEQTEKENEVSEAGEEKTPEEKTNENNGN